MSTPNTVPRLGGVRCYWALLVPQYGPPGPGGGPGKLELKFVYVDPVLNSHLGRQNISFLNRGVLELIHPSEREQARTDLTNAIQSDDLQGSVTRIRFSRVSCIRKMLGAQPQELDVPPEMASVTEDSDYLIVDLVLNWVADGLLLAFFHAIKDMDPSANSDPSRRHEGWSNFCGSSGMSEEQAAALQQNISMHVSPPQRTRYPPRRVFQLHSVQSNGSHPTSSLVFSWPPPRPMDVPSQPFDGLYDPDEYADMMRGVDMDPNALAAKPGEVRTNCTTRFGAEHSIRTEGVYRHISSVFIPYDQIIFACFQTTKLYELPNSSSVSTAQESWGSPTPTPPGAGPPGPLHGARGGTPHTPHAPSREWQTPTGTPGSEYDRAPYAPPPPPPQGPGGHYAPEYAPPHPYPQPGAHPGVHGYPDGNADYHHHHGPRLGEPPLHHHAPAAPPPPPSRGGGSTRPLVRPPGDVEKCRGCGTRESPEWRKGENGVKDLCNACGLKLARAVAKREGRQKPRKKDK